MPGARLVASPTRRELPRPRPRPRKGVEGARSLGAGRRGGRAARATRPQPGASRRRRPGLLELRAGRAAVGQQQVGRQAGPIGSVLPYIPAPPADCVVSDSLRGTRGLLQEETGFGKKVVQLPRGKNSHQ